MKFGELNDPPISNLFSPGVLKGDFLPSKKSHALTMNLCLKKNSSPIFSESLWFSTASASSALTFSSPAANEYKTSRKFSNLDQFLATWVLRIEKHLVMNLLLRALYWVYSALTYSMS